jgi:hypothetical protein
MKKISKIEKTIKIYFVFFNFSKIGLFEDIEENFQFFIENINKGH